MNRNDKIIARLLIFYLFIFGMAAATTIIIIFPEDTGDGALKFANPLTSENGLILLALLAGMTGSFLHASQSIITYVGNGDFRASWAAWYGLRPWIGAILGFAIYFAFRSGLVAGANSVNPYGVTAIGVLAGWFSKTTSDKLQEVFETLFKTNEDAKRKNKLTDPNAPSIEKVVPSPIPEGTEEIRLEGANFPEAALVMVNGDICETEGISETKIQIVKLKQISEGEEVRINIMHPEDPSQTSKIFKTVIGPNPDEGEE